MKIKKENLKIYEYKEIFEALNKLSKNYFHKKDQVNSQRLFTICLSELYLRSISFVRIINDLFIISEKTEIEKKELELLFSNLVQLEVEIYEETVDWIKKFKKPLFRMINEIITRNVIIFAL